MINSYNKERLNNRKMEILELLNNGNHTKEEEASLETELSNVINQLAKMK